MPRPTLKLTPEERVIRRKEARKRCVGKLSLEEKKRREREAWVRKKERMSKFTPEELLEYRKKRNAAVDRFRLRNPEKKKAWNAAWMKKDRDKNYDQYRVREKMYAAANKDKKSRWDKEYRSRYPKKVKEMLARYYRENKEDMNSRSRNYYLKNSDRLKAMSSKWAKDNPEKVNARNRRWCSENPHKVNAMTAARRARLRNLVRIDSDKNIMRSFYELSKRVSRCLAIPFNVDHIIPIAKGGFHHQLNLQVIPEYHNSRKIHKLDYILPFDQTPIHTLIKLSHAA